MTSCLAGLFPKDWRWERPGTGVHFPHCVIHPRSSSLSAAVLWNRDTALKLTYIIRQHLKVCKEEPSMGEDICGGGGKGNGLEKSPENPVL